MLIATAIAELLYPAERFRQPGMRACDYTELARRSYAKEYLKPLREAACVPGVGAPLPTALGLRTFISMLLVACGRFNAIMMSKIFCMLLRAATAVVKEDQSVEV